MAQPTHGPIAPLPPGARQALGRGLMGENGYGIDVDGARTASPATSPRPPSLGVELCLVVGGGNIYRGLAAATDGMDRVSGDYMGMLATVLNGLALGHALEAKAAARVMSAIPMPSICEPFIRARALAHLAEGHLLVLVGGTGNPFFTTDTTAALRAAEIGLRCDASRRPRSTASITPTRKEPQSAPLRGAKL